MFVLKVHINTIFDEDLGKYENLLLLDSSLDMYPLLPCSTALLTDYSSVFFDYALLNKKIIFYPFDLENYRLKNRELYFTYEDLTKGEPIAHSFNELLTIISQNDLAGNVTPSFKKYLNQGFDYNKEINFIKQKVGLRESA